MTTTFPTNGDYVQALQHTDVCFHDQDLKAGRVDLTPLGMPRAISGNFASVFSITGSSGKRYAVKCFTRDVKGQHRRYQSIHGVLAGLARPWQVGFEYIKQGVLVDGQWHAILRMEWVEESKTLIPWLGENLGHPERIMHVAKQFAACIGDLNSAGIAHGDLQHGNVLIDANDTLRVIDYDGMFVPSIEDLGSNELGLANYQHPLRTSGDFAPYLDRFSAWLIYGSLLSLAANPGLWWTFRQEGDEKLLFGKEDFIPPLDSIKRLELLGSPHAQLSELLIESLRSRTLASVPEFDPERIPLPEPSQMGYQPASSPTGMSAWWQQPGVPAITPPTADDAGQAVRLGTGWLRSHEAPLPPVELTGPSRAAKAMSLVIAAVALLSVVYSGFASNFLFGGLVLLTWAAAMTAGTWMLWRRSDAVVDRTAARRQAKQVSRDAERQRKRVGKARSARADLDADERRAIQTLENERSKLTKSAATEYERQTKDLQKHVAALQKDLAGLDASKAREVQQQLKTLQEQHIQTYMSKRHIEAGVIHGIGPALSAALWVHGLRTAADIGGINGSSFRRAGENYWFTIHGIGPSKAFHIQSWHGRVLAAATGGAPQSLPLQSMHALDNKYADQKRQKQAAIDATGPQLRQIKASVDAKYAKLDQEITLKVEAVRMDYRRRRSAGDATVAQEAMQLQSLDDALLNAQRNLDRYQHISFSKYLIA